MARRLTACFELVTPAFASGADPQRAELRVEAVIGQLRRWWWAQAPLDPSFKSDDPAAFANALFGAAGTDNGKTGQGAFLVMLSRSDLAPNTPCMTLRKLFGPAWHEDRTWLWAQPPRFFDVEFLLRPRRPVTKGTDDVSLVAGLRRALILWGLLGGIGAGQRRGFGSVRLVKLCEECATTPLWSAPGTKDEFVRTLSDLLPNMGMKSGPYQFGSFGGGAPAASIWMAELANCNNGKAALYTLQQHLSALRDYLDSTGALVRVGWPPRKQYAINVLSHQSNAEGRNPSRFHFHVAQLDSSMALVLSVLPREDHYRADRAAWIVGKATTPESLVKRLGMKRVLPCPSGAAP